MATESLISRTCATVVAATLTVAALCGLDAAAAAGAEPAADPVASDTAGESTDEPHLTAHAEIEVRVQLTEYAESVQVVLPAMRCPAATPYVWDQIYDTRAAPPLRFPLGLEPRANAHHVVSATWAEHIVGEHGAAVGLEKGSSLTLAAPFEPGEPARFVLQCTDALGMAVGFGSISQPAPIEIGVAVHQQLELRPGVTVGAVSGLPRGLALSREGLLTGTVPPSPAGETRVGVRLSNGRAELDRVIVVRVHGRTIQHTTKSWTVPKRGETKPGAQLCPPEHPWTIAHQFHDPFWSLQKVPNGVQAVTHPGLVEVQSRKFLDGAGYSRGLTDIVVSFNGLEPQAGVHFVLHCTNDSNAAGR